MKRVFGYDMTKKGYNSQDCNDCNTLRGPLNIFIHGESILFENICFKTIKQHLKPHDFKIVIYMLHLIDCMEAAALQGAECYIEIRRLEALIDIFCFESSKRIGGTTIAMNNESTEQILQQTEAEAEVEVEVEVEAEAEAEAEQGTGPAAASASVGAASGAGIASGSDDSAVGNAVSTSAVSVAVGEYGAAAASNSGVVAVGPWGASAASNGAVASVTKGSAATSGPAGKSSQVSYDKSKAKLYCTADEESNEI